MWAVPLFIQRLMQIYIMALTMMEMFEKNIEQANPCLSK